MDPKRETAVKVCKVCEVEKPESEFYQRTNNNVKTVFRRLECKACVIERQRIKRLGVCNVKYAELLEAQGGRCGICRSKLASSRNTKLCVDHNHITGRVRGLLCTQCNVGLGMFKDSPIRLEAAIVYIKNHS